MTLPKLSELDARRKYNDKKLKANTRYSILQGDVLDVERKLNEVHANNKCVDVLQMLNGDEEDHIIILIKVVAVY